MMYSSKSLLVRKTAHSLLHHHRSSTTSSHSQCASLIRFYSATPANNNTPTTNNTPTEPVDNNDGDTVKTSDNTTENIKNSENVFRNRQVLKQKPTRAAIAQTHRILATGISITVPPMRLVEKLTIPKKAHELTPEDIQELEKEQYKNRMKDAVGYIPDGYEYDKAPQTVPEFVERRRKNREELEQLLARDDVDSKFKEKITEVLELEDMVKKYIEEEKPQNMTDPRLEPRIPGVDYDKWSAPAPGTEAAKNEPISNWESKFAGKTVGHGAPASYSQLIGIILATCLASAVTLGLAKPGFDQYIMEPLFGKKESDSKDVGLR